MEKTKKKQIMNRIDKDLQLKAIPETYFYDESRAGQTYLELEKEATENFLDNEEDFSEARGKKRRRKPKRKRRPKKERERRPKKELTWRERLKKSLEKRRKEKEERPKRKPKKERPKKEVRDTKKEKRKKLIAQTAGKLWKKSGKTLPFKKWLAQAKKSGLLEKAIDTAFGKKGAVTQKELDELNDDTPITKGTKILGMPPIAAIGVGTALIGLIGFAIYKMFWGKGKGAPTPPPPPPA